MERGEEIFRGVVRANKERLAQFEDKLCERITALSLLVEIPARNGSTTHWLNEVWQLLNTQESTRPLAIYLAASLTVVDRMFLFDAVLSRLTEPGSGLAGGEPFDNLGMSGFDYRRLFPPCA